MSRKPTSAATRHAAGVLAALLLLFAAGCVAETGQQELADTTAVRGATAQGERPHLPADSIADANVVRVSLLEYEIYAPDSIPAGPNIFRVSNNGTRPHSLSLTGDDAEASLEGTMPEGGGDQMSLYVYLEPGTYTLFCPVEDHADRGMMRELTVYPASDSVRNDPIDIPDASADEPGMDG